MPYTCDGCGNASCDYCNSPCTHQHFTNSRGMVLRCVDCGHAANLVASSPDALQEMYEADFKKLLLQLDSAQYHMDRPRVTEVEKELLALFRKVAK